MAIENNVRILNKEYLTSGSVTSHSLKKSVIRGLENKWKAINLRLINKGNIYLYPTDWSKTLSSNEPYFFNEYSSQNQELHALLRATVIAEFLLMGIHGRTRANRLQDTKGNYLEDFRYSKRLVFSDGRKVSSWSNIVSLSDRGLKWSISDPYPKHLYNAKLEKITESMYGEGLDPVKIEDLVLEKGFGKFTKENRAYFFAKFDDKIGYVPGSNGQKIPTDTLKVQVDRVTRPLKTQGGKKHRQGFFFHMHGYPISDNELQADSGSLYNDIVCNKLKIPT
ncbi:hypothetical protein B9J80_09480 [Vibrio sp. V12_P9A6T4]|uniref:hypothetical protein n=1 Tax=Vibrio sp. V12_P9A6T4 TaxID=1938667 RepID=UPI000B8EE560|nr:hypothetical protein [Vibrio sp. V12_P9A6T4]OXX53435.1 hypothetical protein B9J80_09480 [Vibrio sp. V12_P9A6T4]